jgi:hypothetical protein
MRRLTRVLQILVIALIITSCAKSLKSDVIDRGSYRIVYLSDTTVSPIEVKQINVFVGESSYTVFETLTSESRKFHNVADYESLMLNSIDLESINEIAKSCQLNKAEQIQLLKDIFSQNRDYTTISSKEQLDETLCKQVQSTKEIKKIRNVIGDDNIHLIYIRNISLIYFRIIWSKNNEISRIRTDLYYHNLGDFIPTKIKKQSK